MARGKTRARSRIAKADELPVLFRILETDPKPSLHVFLELGKELHAARLDYFIENAFPDSSEYPVAIEARKLLFHCTRHFRAPEAKESDIEFVKKEILNLRQEHWYFIRDELAKFFVRAKEKIAERNVTKVVVINKNEPSEESLNPTEKAALKIIKSQPKGKGILGKEIRAELKLLGITIVDSTFRSHVIGKLKKHYHVTSHPAKGGYLIE